MSLSSCLTETTSPYSVGPRAVSDDPNAETLGEIPGESIPLDPFVLTLNTIDGEVRAAKVQLTIELDKETAAEAFQVFIPRVRDTLLNYLRSQTYETIADNKHKQAMAQEMLDAVHKVGGDAVTAVLIQDLIVQ